MRVEELGPVGPENVHLLVFRGPLNIRNFSCCVFDPPFRRKWRHSDSPSIDCFLCFGGRLRLSGMTRVTAGAIPEFRAARRASVPLSKTFFRFFIPASGWKFSGIRN